MKKKQKNEKKKLFGMVRDTYLCWSGHARNRLYIHLLKGGKVKIILITNILKDH